MSASAEPLPHYRQSSSVLGDLRATYGSRTPRRLLIILWLGTPLFLAGSGLLTFLLLTDTSTANPDDLIAAIVLDVIIGALGLALPIVWWWNRGRTVHVFEQGIEYSQRGRSVPVRWEEIASVFFTNIEVRVNGISTGRNATCTLEGPSFGRIRLTHWFDGVEDVASLIQRTIYPRMLEQATAAWQRGEPVVFGPLTLTQHGITVRSKQLPWSSLAQLYIDGGWVTVRARGKMLAWTTLGRSKVPNAIVLDAMVKRAMQLSAQRIA